MTEPIVNRRCIDKLRAIALKYGLTNEDAKEFGKLSRTATWEALLEEEADNLKGLAKEKTDGARQAKRTYEALGKIEEADAKVHKHHRKYEGVVAEVILELLG